MHNISLDDNQATTLLEALTIAEDNFNFDGEYEKAALCGSLANLLYVKVGA